MVPNIRALDTTLSIPSHTTISRKNISIYCKGQKLTGEFPPNTSYVPCWIVNHTIFSVLYYDLSALLKSYSDRILFCANNI